jgi:hypothetical protein
MTKSENIRTRTLGLEMYDDFPDKRPMATNEPRDKKYSNKASQAEPGIGFYVMMSPFLLYSAIAERISSTMRRRKQ